MTASEHQESSDAVASRRAIADAPSLQALTHPTRMALLEAIAVSGPLTATQASRVVGESPTACAYHLRMLGRLGFVTQAEGGTGRERPWQLAQAGMSFGQGGDDPGVAQAADTLSKTLTERFIRRIRNSELNRSRLTEELREATGFSQSVIFATPAEMQELRDELIALTSRYIDRMHPGSRPPGSRAFEIVMFTHLFAEATDSSGEGDESSR